jgi:hypothetical protein
MMLRAGIHMLPVWLIERLDLHHERWSLKPWERRLLRRLGAWLERVPIPGSPPVNACRRLGLPGNYLYRRRASFENTPDTRVVAERR